MKHSGFSLIELLIAMGLLILVLGSMYSIFAYNQKTFSVQDQVLALNQNILGVTEVIGREARAAGLKVALSGGTLGPVAQMIPSGFLPSTPVSVSLNPGDYPVKVTPGGGANPDAVTIVGAMGKNTFLSGTVEAGDTAISLKDAAGLAAGDVIYVGEDFENAKVIAVSGNQLTIDTDPTKNGNQGFSKKHLVGSEVGEISVITYSLFKSETPPVLMRKENVGSFEPLAADVTDLQADQNEKIPNIRLTARTAYPDRDYPDTGGYRQKTFLITVAPKNIK